MSKLKDAYERIVRAYKIKRSWSKPEKNTGFIMDGTEPLPRGFDPRSSEASKPLDDVNSDIKQVLPTYYEYDENGEPTGKRKGEGPYISND